MQRLTFEGNFCDIAQCAEMHDCDYGEKKCSQRKTWERLKEYEDTGLSPQEVDALKIEVYTEEDVRQAYTDGYSCGMEQGMEKAVRHGRWVMKHRHHGGFRRYTGVDDYGAQHTITVDERFELDEPYCPFCGKWNESVFLNYCPNCGAKMDGEE